MAIRNYMQNFDMNPLQTVSEMGQGFRRNQIMQQQIDQNQNAMQRVQNQEAMDKDLGEAYAAGGNYDEYLKAHPQDFERVHQLQQMQQQMRDKGAGKAAFMALNHLQAGDIDGFNTVIDSSADFINNTGDPTFTTETFKRMAQEDPQQAAQMLAGVMHMSGFEPMKSQQVKPMTEYQQNQTRQRQQEIDLKREENKLKAEERKLKQETNELKKQQLEKDIEERKQNISQKKTDDMKRIDDGILKAEDGIKTVDEFLSNDDYINAMTGYRGVAPALPGTGTEAESYFENIKNSMTLENLGVMSGPLTDKDIAIIASASSRLRAGMGETAMRKELNTIKEAYQRVIKNFNKEKSEKGYKAKEQSLKDLSDEDLLNG